MNGLLLIDSLAYGGSGVGRLDGKVVFVPLTAPGDRIRCRVVQDRKRYAEAELVELLEPASQRRRPPCPVFGDCGGCQWQHLPYEEQCRWKERIFAETLQRQAKIKASVLLPLTPAQDEWGYRSRAQFKCRQTEAGFVMGFYRRGTHYVIDVESCPIVAPRLNHVLALFRQWLPDSPCPHRVPQVDLEIDDEEKVRVTVHALGAEAAVLAQYLQPLAEQAGISLFLQLGRKETLVRVCGEEDLHILPLEAGGLRLAYGAGGFAQVNLEQNRQLVEEVCSAAALSGRERVLDLFCGMGNFSLPLALQAREVIGVENYPPAIERAEFNARTNALANARFHARPAEAAIQDVIAGKAFDLVVLDPPRTGAYEVVRELLRIRPPRIIYVSCDPPTLARDLVPLLHGGYEIVSSRPFDLFPQTFHTESVTVLRLAV
jgi:23S rRNA (uracil1939-C5)-methyltransferase